MFLLNRNDVDTNVKDFDEHDALFFAAIGSNCEVIEILIRKGADIHSRDKLQETPLYAAVDQGNLTFEKN